LSIPNEAEALPDAFWFIVTALGVLGAGWLVLHLVHGTLDLARGFYCSRRDSGLAARLFLLLSALFYYAVLLFTPPVQERYLLPLIGILVPLMAALASSGEGSPPCLRPRILPRLRCFLAVLLLLLFASFGIGAMRDWLICNRVSWRLLTALIQDDGVSPIRINGGWEFFAWNFFEDKRMAGNDYILSGKAIPGYDVYSSASFTHWIPPAKTTISILQRAKR